MAELDDILQSLYVPSGLSHTMNMGPLRARDHYSQQRYTRVQEAIAARLQQPLKETDQSHLDEERIVQATYEWPEEALESAATMCLLALHLLQRSLNRELRHRHGTRVGVEIVNLALLYNCMVNQFAPSTNLDIKDFAQALLEKFPTSRIVDFDEDVLTMEEDWLEAWGIQWHVGTRELCEELARLEYSLE